MPDAPSLFAVTVDCPAPAALARFYQAVAGGEITHATEDFVALSNAGGVRIDFQRVQNPAPAAWPDPETPRRVHLDFLVDDLDDEEERVMKLGAVRAEEQPGGQRFRVFIDPAGHAFCLAKDT
jgi:predicted enzyme related to lactoylglutathione lyase